MLLGKSNLYLLNTILHSLICDTLASYGEKFHDCTVLCNWSLSNKIKINPLKELERCCVLLYCEVYRSTMHLPSEDVLVPVN